MKTKIILGLATLATLAGMAAPAMADDGYRFRDHDRAYYSRDYRAREAREMRERRERIERERREHYRRYGYYR